MVTVYRSGSLADDWLKGQQKYSSIASGTLADALSFMTVQFGAVD